MAKYERREPFIQKDHAARRNGIYIGISGMDIPNVFDGARLTMKAFFNIIDVKYHGELLVRDMDHIRDVTTRPDLMEAAYKKGSDLGRALVEGT